MGKRRVEFATSGAYEFLEGLSSDPFPGATGTPVWTGIRVPSLVVVGENDTPFLAASDYMTAKIPGAEKAVIPNAGHAANIDNPAAFNAALEGFLAKLS